MEVIASPRMEKQVRDYMRAAAEEAIKKAAIEVEAILQKNIVKYTYDYDYFPNIRYEGGSGFPSLEFLHSFKRKNIKSSAVWVSQEIFHDWNSMTTNSATFRHWGSYRKYKGKQDSRKYLARILNNEDNGTRAFRTPNWGREDGKMRKPFWNITMDELLRKHVLDDLFTKYLKPYGFKKV